MGTGFERIFDCAYRSDFCYNIASKKGKTMHIAKFASLASLLAIVGCVCCDSFDAEKNSAVSPDGRNEIRLYSDPLAYEVVRDGVVVAARSEIGMKVNGNCLAI